ncbi:calumenin-A isoform X1 [Pleuronectes platessa]|uniref:calumenin-A isoform X1 n=1 Tax=Pleuronectes platessa TaxID=8262 RepID=UPI00232A4E00|nr:calumenin-A isoform X1 [Pleuronectes platessa]
MIRLLLICFVSCVVLGSSEQPEKKSGVIEKEPLSHLEDQHDHDHEHLHDHEHEALLEPDGARSFNQLAPEESIAQLAILVDRIDVDKDDFISEDELKTWIQNVQRNYTNGQVEDRWSDFDTDEDGLISWDEYKNVTYGIYMNDPLTKEDVNVPQMLQEERRFRAADTDADMKLHKQEFNAFLHPENFHHMRDVVVQETIDDFDKNGDGFIDLNEFMDVLFPPGNDDNDPEQMEKQRRDFLEIQDANKDEKLDKQELMQLIFPPNYNVAGSEAKQLLKESDTNKDGKLTKTEILDKHELFVESQVTNYGEAVVPHDEL